MSHDYDRRAGEDPKALFAPFEAKMKALREELESVQARLTEMGREIDAIPAKKAPSDYRSDISKAQREAKKALSNAVRNIMGSYDALKMLQLRAGHIHRGE